MVGAALSTMVAADGSATAAVSLCISSFGAESTALALVDARAGIEGEDACSKLKGELARARETLRAKSAALLCSNAKAKVLEQAVRSRQREFSQALKRCKAQWTAGAQALRTKVQEMARTHSNLRWARKSRLVASQERAIVLAEMSDIDKQNGQLRRQVQRLEADLARARASGQHHLAGHALAAKNLQEERTHSRALGKVVSAETSRSTRLEREATTAQEQVHVLARESAAATAAAELEAKNAHVAAANVATACQALEAKHAHRIDELISDFAEQRCSLEVALAEAQQEAQDAQAREKERVPPHVKDSGEYSDGGERWARKQEIDFLGALFEEHSFRPETVATVLKNNDSLEEVFNTRQMWRLRLEWLRVLFAHIQEEHWDAQKAVAIIVSLNLSEASSMELNNFLGKRIAASRPPPFTALADCQR